jgi:FlaG/FlaF family flagellin (archaellin)
LAAELRHFEIELRGGEMKTRTVLLALVVCIAGVTAGFAANAHIGTWKLNESKSKFGPGTSKNTTVVYEGAGDSVKVTVDGIDGAGKPAHNEWTGKFDGKDYSLTGSPTSDTRAYKQVDDRTLTFTEKKGGTVATTGRIVVSADGKSRTVTTVTTNPEGQKVNTSAVYDKQ